MAAIMKRITGIVIALGIIFGILYSIFKTDIWLFLTITFVTTAYHFVMRLFVGFVFDRILNNKVDYNRKWFQISTVEVQFYNAIKVKKWKNRMPTYDPKRFSNQKHTWDEIAQAMCQAELVHETIAILSFLPIIMSIWWEAFGVFLITSVCAAFLDLSFVIIQRYNRPRVLRLIKRDKHMSEKEKMLHGEWHDANFDKTLLEKRRKAELLCYDFNMAKPGTVEQQSALKQLLGRELPEGVTVLAPVYFDYGEYTNFGKGTFVNHGCYFMDGGTIHIGENVFIGPFCGFYTASHPINYTDRNKGIEKALPIKIGDNCWFGANVSVLQGVTIGAGCVIAAGTVVTKDVPENCLVAGVPATIKKRIKQ